MFCGRKTLSGTQCRNTGINNGVCNFHLAMDERAAQKAKEEADKIVQITNDRAMQNELNLRVEGLTGEPSHLTVVDDRVIGLTVADLEAIIRVSEDRALGLT